MKEVKPRLDVGNLLYGLLVVTLLLLASVMDAFVYGGATLGRNAASGRGGAQQHAQAPSRPSSADVASVAPATPRTH